MLLKMHLVILHYFDCLCRCNELRDAELSGTLALCSARRRCTLRV